ncbi:hypothetical protein V1264_007236 [Littorina saxatilis]
MAAFQHSVVLTALSVVAFLAAILHGSTVSPPGGECEGQFMQGLFTCFTDHNVPFNTFLWVVSNGTGGISPDNETVFKEQMCGIEDEVVQCVLGSLHALVDTPHCHDADGMERLLTVQIRAIFEEYDAYCAHACRHTLEDDMKQCYSDSGLDPTLFMPSTKDGAILGTTESSVADFCNNTDALVDCMRTKRDACPEAPYVLKRLGLDLDIFSRGLQILCREQDVYLSSLECFEAQTRQVEKCLEDNRLTLMRLLSRTKTENVSQDSFINEFCLARVQYIRCDLSSWAAKPHEACDTPALALKRDLHCSQIPQACSQTLAGPIDKVCTYNWASVTLSTTGGKSMQSGEPPSSYTPRREFVSVLAVMVLVFSWNAI